AFSAPRRFRSEQEERAPSGLRPQLQPRTCSMADPYRPQSWGGALRLRVRQEACPRACRAGRKESLGRRSERGAAPSISWSGRPGAEKVGGAVEGKPATRPDGKSGDVLFEDKFGPSAALSAGQRVAQTALGPNYVIYHFVPSDVSKILSLPIAGLAPQLAT